VPTISFFLSHRLCRYPKDPLKWLVWAGRSLSDGSREAKEAVTEGLGGRLRATEESLHNLEANHDDLQEKYVFGLL
jgi:hypothetical protein